MITSLLAFLVVLSLLILVHELGHFLAARRAGIWVEEFGLGLPPRIAGKKIGETLYSLNLLPFGGFVKLHGENDEEGVIKPKRAFINKSKKTRLSVVIAGVVMNFILAITAFSITYSFTGVPHKTDEIKVVNIAPDSPAKEAGLLPGDRIVKVDSFYISSIDQFVKFMKQKAEKEVVLTYNREDGSLGEAVLTPRRDPPEGEGAIGVVVTQSEIYFPPVWQRPFYGIYFGFREAVYWGWAVILGFKTIFSQLFSSGQVPADLAGPVGIYAITSQVASYGLMALINFIGILSVNLAILNIFPFPALDGGRLLFIGIEAITGRRVVPKIEAYIHTAGMLILITALLAITAHDVQKLISAGSLAGFLETFTP